MSKVKQLTFGNVIALLLECLDCDKHATSDCPARALSGTEAFTARSRCIWGDEALKGRWELGDFGKPKEEKS